jgi:long-chain acyl-CoA synthetase
LTYFARYQNRYYQWSHLSKNSMHWFHRTELVSRWLADFISSQMRQLRPRYTPPELFTEQMRLDRSSADIDSIELVELASALYLALDAEDSGALNDYAQQNGNLGPSFASWCKFVCFAAEKTSSMWFQTSGSTGQRRWIVHRLADLQSEVHEVAAILQTGGHVIQRVVSIMPSHHVYGFLFGVLLPALLGLPALHLRATAPAMLRAQLKPGDLLIAHPSFWSSALLSTQTSANRQFFPTSVIGLSSGQALPGVLFDTAQRSGLVRLIELYGATETAGIAWRDSDSGFSLLSRYAWANAMGNSLIDTWSTHRPVVVPPDSIERLPANQFYLQGRPDRVVQIAGQNVHLDAIEARLSMFPGINAARLRQMPANDPKARLHAFIVSDRPINTTELRTFAETHLQTAELPQSYTFGTEILKTEAGKECDWVVGA